MAKHATSHHGPAAKASADLKENLAALGLPLPVEQPASEPEDDGDSDEEDEDAAEESEAGYSFDDDSDEDSGPLGDGSSTYATSMSRCTSSSSRLPGSIPLRTRQISIRSLPGREDIEVIRYRTPREFIEAVQPYEQWQIAPVLAPAAALLHLPRQENRRNYWLCAFSRSRGRLELVCTKLEGAPIMLAAPTYPDRLSGPHLIGALSTLETEMHTILPTPTRGDCDPHILGPTRLAIPFAKLWRRTHGIREAVSPTPSSPVPSELKHDEEPTSLRNKVLKLCHLPDSKQILPNAPLPDLFVIRHATADDDHERLADMLVDSAKEQGRLLSFWEARQMVVKGIERSLVYVYFCRSQRTPTISLTAGILLTSERTKSTMAILDVYVPENFRRRGVGEALVRWATINFFETPSPPTSPDPSDAPSPSPGPSDAASPSPGLQTPRCVVAMLATDKANEAVPRMLSRVGFRLTKAKRSASGLLELPAATSIEMTPVSTTTSASSGSSTSHDRQFSTDSVTKRPGINRQASYQRWIEVDPSPRTAYHTGATTPELQTPRPQPLQSF